VPWSGQSSSFGYSCFPRCDLPVKSFDRSIWVTECPHCSHQLCSSIIFLSCLIFPVESCPCIIVNMLFKSLLPLAVLGLVSAEMESMAGMDMSAAEMQSSNMEMSAAAANSTMTLAQALTMENKTLSTLNSTSSLSLFICPQAQILKGHRSVGYAASSRVCTLSGKRHYDPCTIQ
jgi:hypothetical protein